MSQQGKTLSLEQKQFIVNLKLSYDVEKTIGSTISTKDSVGRVAKGLGIGKRTVENILAQYKKNGQILIGTEPKPRGKPPFSLDGSLIPHIRHYVRSMNQTGQYLSVRRIRSWLIQEHKTDIPIP
jgi:transposase